MGSAFTSTAELLMARTAQATSVLQVLIVCATTVSAFRRTRSIRTWSAAVMIVSSFVLLRDYYGVLADQFLSGIEAPLIEPWFFTKALTFSSTVLALALTARAILLKRGAMPVLITGVVVVCVAILNQTKLYLFIPTSFVSYFVIAAIWGTAAIAAVDLLTERKTRPNKTPLPTPVDGPPSKHSQVPGAADL